MNNGLFAKYSAIRSRTLELMEPLLDKDCCNRFGSASGEVAPGYSVVPWETLTGPDRVNGLKQLLYKKS
jgi:hypothetical protein